MTTPASPPVAPRVHKGVSRVVWLVAGMVAVALGGIGVVVPGLPTTIFFIVAASCFARSSPRFERWVLDLPKIGPMVRDHRDGLGMARRTKAIALAMMWVGILVAVGLVGTAYILWRVPTRERVLAARTDRTSLA